MHQDSAIPLNGHEAESRANTAASFSSPPESLQGLRAVLAEIDAGRGPAGLGRRAVQAYRGMLAAPRRAAMVSITELSQVFGVHPSTLSRLAQALGYRGFGGLQSVFRRHVAQTGHFYSEQAEALAEVSATNRSGFSLLSRIARDERANIQGMLNNLDRAQIREVARTLATSPRVRVLGARQSQPLAAFFAYALGMLHDGAAVLSADSGLAHGLAQLRAGDVVVIFGFAPYTKHTVVAARLAREYGVVVVCITDSAASPLADHANYAITVPTGGHFFTNNVAGAMVLGEGLLAIVANELGDSAQTALQHREDLIAKMDVQL